MGSFFGGGSTPAGTSTGTQATTTQPWGPVQPYLLGAAQSAQSLFNQGTPQIWQGQYLPNQSPQTQGYVGGVTNYTNSGVPQAQIANAQGVAQNIANGQGLYGGNSFLQNLLQGGGTGNQYAQALMPNYLSGGPTNQAQGTAQGLLTNMAAGNITQNPYLNSMYQNASLPMIQQWQNQIQPGIESAFSAAGRYGSNAMGSTMNQAETGLGQGLGSLASSLYGNAYGQNLAAQTNAQSQLANLGLGQSGQQLNLGNLLGNLQNTNLAGALGLNQSGVQGGALQLGAAQAQPGLAMAGYGPYQQLGQAGQTMDQYNTQNQLYQEQLYNYMNGGGAWNTMQNYANILNLNPATRATQTNTTTTQGAPTQSGFSQALGGLSGLSGLLGYNGIGSMLGTSSGGGLFGSGGLLGALGIGGGAAAGAGVDLSALGGIAGMGAGAGDALGSLGALAFL